MKRQIIVAVILQMALSSGSYSSAIEPDFDGSKITAEDGQASQAAACVGKVSGGEISLAGEAAPIAFASVIFEDSLSGDTSTGESLVSPITAEGFIVNAFHEQGESTWQAEREWVSCSKTGETWITTDTDRKIMKRERSDIYVCTVKITQTLGWRNCNEPNPHTAPGQCACSAYIKYKNEELTNDCNWEAKDY